MDMVDLTSSGIAAGTVERSLQPLQGSAQQTAGDGSLAVVANAQDVSTRAAAPAVPSGGPDSPAATVGRMFGKGTLVDTVV
jgi:hypothetical protein